MTDKRLILLGIDGMDYELTESNLDSLPNIKQLLANGIVSPFRSVFPPDSIPAWITAYTGLDPSEHGVLESVDYLAKKNARCNINTTSFKGKTFWDVLGRAGIDVCVINPFMAYPVWPVNGVMVNGPVFIDGDIQVSNPSMVNGVRLPKSFGGITDFPTKKTLGQFLKKTMKDTEEQIEFGLSMFKKHRPQLFFQSLLTMDRIQHFLWRYCDQEDPTYPGVNVFKNAIRDFYIYIDSMIGHFLNAMDSNDQLIVISDHGHGMRCTHCFNINEYLRRKGYVKSNAEGKFFSKKLIIEKLKNRFLRFMNDNDLEDYISIIAKFIPNAKAIKKGNHITDSSNNKVYASDFTGTNPFGGICINRELVKDYRSILKQIILDLKTYHYEGEQVFEWICLREEMYNGPFLEKFPDILFEMKSYLGVNWALHTELFTVNPTHKKVSGGHRKYGVCIMNKAGEEKIFPERFEIKNLYPSIINHYNTENKKKDVKLNLLMWE